MVVFSRGILRIFDQRGHVLIEQQLLGSDDAMRSTRIRFPADDLFGGPNVITTPCTLFPNLETATTAVTAEAEVYFYNVKIDERVLGLGEGDYGNKEATEVRGVLRSTLPVVEPQKVSDQLTKISSLALMLWGAILSGVVYWVFFAPVYVFLHKKIYTPMPVGFREENVNIDTWLWVPVAASGIIWGIAISFGL